MNGTPALLIAVPLLFAASYFGSTVGRRLARNHLNVQTMLSFVGGLMLGMGFLHLLPHAVLDSGSLDRSMFLALLGVLLIFLLIRYANVHSHGEDVECIDSHTHDGHTHTTPMPDSGRVRWMTLLVGLALHSVIDGVAVAAAIRAGDGHGGWSGAAVLLVVLLHKPIDAVAMAATLSAAGVRVRTATAVNVGLALVAPAAAVASYAGLSSGSAAASAMAFSAGAFICVALADLMPELQFHSHHRLRLTAGLLAGIGIAALLGVLEGDTHGRSSAPAEHRDHTHELPHSH
jgi:zinc and cadmium transporter